VHDVECGREMNECFNIIGFINHHIKHTKQ